MNWEHAFYMVLTFLPATIAWICMHAAHKEAKRAEKASALAVEAMDAAGESLIQIRDMLSGSPYRTAPPSPQEVDPSASIAGAKIEQTFTCKTIHVPTIEERYE